MQELLPVLVVAIVAVLVWAVARPQALFIVRVRHGQSTTVRGKVTDAFLAVVADVFQEFGVPTGEIRGIGRGRRISLWFSSNVPPAACQRLRNWWALSGWSAKPGRG